MQASFADLLDQHLGPGPAAGYRASIGTPAAFVWAAASTPFRATPYASMGGSRPRAAAAGPAQGRRARRTLTAAKQRAFDALICLGATLPPDFTAGELRSAFRTLARALHPDRHPATPDDEKARLARLFATAADSYRVLSH